MCSVTDFCLYGTYSVDELSWRSMAGRGQGGKGLLDIAIMRYRLKEYFLGPYLNDTEYDKETNRLLCDVLKSQETYREKVGTSGPVNMDRSFLSLLPESDQLLLSGRCRPYCTCFCYDRCVLFLKRRS